jgi:predicted RecB family endonuclease
MAEVSIFEAAVRAKFRFPFRGSISVEDLFDLSLTDLDSIFKVLNSQLKQPEESLLNVRTKEDQELSTKIEIIKHIVAVKLAEQNAKVQAKEQSERRQRILEVMKSKKDQELQDKTPAELQAMLDELS